MPTWSLWRKRSRPVQSEWQGNLKDTQEYMAKMYVRISSVALFMIAMAPFASAFSVYAPFPLLIATFALGFRWPPAPLWVKFTLIWIVVFFHLDSTGTLINLMSLVVADLGTFAFASIVSDQGLEIAIRRISKMSIWTILLSLPASIFLAVPLDLANPITDILVGGRLRLLSGSNTGHSVALELAAIAIVGILCGALRFLLWPLVVYFLGTALYLSGSLTGGLILVATVGGSLIERAPRFGLLVHLAMISGIMWFINDPEGANKFIGGFRLMVGQDPSNYAGDFSAGRALLNSLLTDLANQSPLTGVGHEHQTLTYGVRIVTGEQTGANSESPLRLAAQYGWPLFLLTFALSAMPLVMGLTSSGLFRRFFIPMGYVVLITGSTNGELISVGQSSAYILMWPIVWLAYIFWKPLFIIRILPERFMHMRKSSDMRNPFLVKLSGERTHVRY